MGGVVVGGDEFPRQQVVVMLFACTKGATPNASNGYPTTYQFPRTVILIFIGCDVCGRVG